MLLSIMLLIILIATEWLPHLPHQFSLTSKQLLFGLSGMIISPFFPLIPLVGDWYLHMGFIGLGLIWGFFGCRLHRGQAVSLMITIVSAALTLFSLHELFHFHTDWSLHSFRSWALVLLVVGSLFTFEQLSEQVSFLLGSLILTHFMILWKHQEILNPRVIGQQEFLDTAWLALLVLMIMQQAILRVRWKEKNLSNE